MDNQFQQPRVKPIFAYLKDSFKFYDMDNPIVAQIVFVIQLAVVFGGYIFARPYMEELSIYFEQFSNKFMTLLEGKALDVSVLNSELYMSMTRALSAVILILMVIKSISFLIGTYYGTYYFYSQTHPSMKGAQRTEIFFKRLPKIILFNLLFYLAFYVGAIALLFILVLLAYVMPLLSIAAMILPITFLGFNVLFIFKDLLIVEFDINIFRNFKKTLDLTRGCKRNVIMNGLWPLCIGWLVSAFAVDIQNPMLSLFIASFIEVIFLLISQRLTALMFIDAASLERPNKKSAKSGVQA